MCDFQRLPGTPFEAHMLGMPHTVTDTTSATGQLDLAASALIGSSIHRSYLTL